MSAHTFVAELQNEFGTKTRRAIITATGSASYDTNGSVLDCSAITGGGFTKVHGIRQVGISAHGNDKYHLTFVPAASYGTSPTIKVRDLSAASDAEVSSTTDLSGVTFILEVIGV